MTKSGRGNKRKHIKLKNTKHRKHRKHTKHSKHRKHTKHSKHRKHTKHTKHTKHIKHTKHTKHRKANLKGGTSFLDTIRRFASGPNADEQAGLTAMLRTAPAPRAEPHPPAEPPPGPPPRPPGRDVLRLNESVEVSTRRRPPPRPPGRDVLRLNESVEASLTTGILEKFFNKRNGSYIIKDKINIISAHGMSLGSFCVIPDELTLYLTSSAGDSAHTRGALTRSSSGPSQRIVDNYIREYKGGSLIQDVRLKFSPFYRSDEVYTPRGLLEYDIPTRLKGPHQEADAHTALEYALTSRRKQRPGQRKTPEYLDLHKDKYFNGNIDSIIHRDIFVNQFTDGGRFKLSDILDEIARAREGGASVAADWFGLFCRSGERLDIEELKKCNEEDVGSPLLIPGSSFVPYTRHESGSLVNQSSLSATPNNFLADVISMTEYVGQEYFNEEHRIKINEIHRTLTTALCPTISYEDVCFVLQMKNLIEHRQ
jgi:hypothetical protein